MKRKQALLAIAGVATAQNTFPASGNVGIGTLTPATSLQTIGTTRLGSATNYAAVDANGNLTFAGTYNYTLIVDGKLVDSKKMVVAK